VKLHFRENERVALFIDGANLHSTARALGFDIDYRRLLKVFRDKGRLVRAHYYTALIEDRECLPMRPLIDWLDYNGYAVITKSAKEFGDAIGRRRVKGNINIELAVDMLEMAQHLDHAILFSGDGDFHHLIVAMQRKGLRVSVVSTLKSSPPVVADELRRQADDFIELSDLAPLIARSPRENDARPDPGNVRDCNDAPIRNGSAGPVSPRRSIQGMGSGRGDRVERRAGGAATGGAAT
jgi:uncharacterized LabA/DUF88 family protein